MVPGRNQFMKTLLPPRARKDHPVQSTRCPTFNCRGAWRGRGSGGVHRPGLLTLVLTCWPRPFLTALQQAIITTLFVSASHRCPGDQRGRLRALLHPPPPSSCPHWWVSLPSRRRVVGGQRNASICQKRLMSVYCFLATTCITKEVQTSRLKLGFNWFVRCLLLLTLLRVVKNS